jgi:hypothetical protein
MQQSAYERRRARRTGRTGLYLAAAALGLVALCVTLAATWESYRRRTQMQNDPRVARVWIAGTTFGARHQLVRGGPLQEWLNERRISMFGDYEVITSQYANDPGSMELWFNYESYLIGQPDLECHRVNPSGTAFEDDLGQPYHGFLDIHGKTVGVYLPGYDHSAHEIRCMLDWMPRRPAGPPPISRPMAFTVKFPPARRTLPAADGLPRTVTATKGGINVTIGEARLGAFKHSNGAIGQRDITFRIKIAGGDLADGNVMGDLSGLLADPSRPTQSSRPATGAGPPIFPPFSIGRFNRLLRDPLLNPYTAADTQLTLTDPYGVPLLAPGQPLTPLITKETVRAAQHGDGVVWVAPVNNAGKGTDAIRVHLDIAPKPRKTAGGRHAAQIPFDLVVPVQTGDEI